MSGGREVRSVPVEPLEEYLDALRERVIRETAKGSDPASQVSDQELRKAIRRVISNEADFFREMDRRLSGASSPSRALTALILSASGMVVVVLSLLIVALSTNVLEAGNRETSWVAVLIGAAAAILTGAGSVALLASYGSRRQRRKESAEAAFSTSLEIRSEIVMATADIEELARSRMPGLAGAPLGRLVDELVVRGVWTHDEMRTFARAMRSRNAIVHGRGGQETSPIELLAQIAELEPLARKLREVSKPSRVHPRAAPSGRTKP